MAESLRILILEDNPVDAELIQFELQEAGFIFTSKVVMTKKDFVHELQEFSPDLILSDYDLPQYNGALALAEAMIRCPDTPFILVTGAVSEDRAIEILTQGAKDYVLKTRLHQRLVPAVRRALAEAEEHKARKKAEAGLIEAYRTLEKQVEERTSELQESKERLNLALTSSRMGAFEWDITENKRYFDDNVHHLLGTNPEKFSGTAEEFFEVIHPDDQSAVQDALNKAIERDTPYETEYRVIWPDESVHYIAARGKVQRDQAGRPLRILGVCWDVTERKRTEEALQESEERYRALIEQANDAIFVTEPAGPGKVLSANPAACRMFGYSADEFVGLDRQSHLDTSDPKLAEMLRHREGQGKAVAEVICRRKDGTTFPAEFATALFTDRIGGQRRSIAIVRDITERKQAEATLREAHEQAEWLARLPEENPNPVMRISADGSVLYCNPASVKIPGWACEIGRQLSDPLLPLFRQAMTGGQEIQQDIALGGRFYSVAVVPIPGEGYANVYGRDITKRKRVEETLQESENKFITAFRNSPVAMMISSVVDGRYVDVNDIFLKDTGYTRDEIIGHTSEELRIFADHHDRERLLSQVRKQGFVYGMETHFRIKSGQILICLVSTSFIYIGGQPHLLSSIVDITDRKQAEAVLQTTLQRLHALVSSIQSCILFVGEGRIELANQAFCEYFELQDSPADLIGLTPRKLIDKIKNSYLYRYINNKR